MANIEYRVVPFAAKQEGGGGEFEGLASVFYCIDDSWWNDIVAPGAFRQDLPQFLAEGFIGGVNHNWDEPIGRPLHAEETAEGLFVKATLSDTTHGRDVRTLMKDGVIRRLSIGFRALGRRVLETPDEVLAWWREAGYVPTEEDLVRARFGARLLTRIRLYECSPVAVPANRGAVITGVKGPDGNRGTGMPLAEHSLAVLAGLEAYLERLESLRELRAGEGRSISADHRSGLRRLRARLDGILREAAAPAPAAGLYEEFRSIEARLRAVFANEGRD